MKTKVIRMRNASLKIAHQPNNLLRRSFQLYHAVQLLQNMHITNPLCLPHFRLWISYWFVIPCIANLFPLKSFTCNMEEYSLHAWKSIRETKYSFHSFDLVFLAVFSQNFLHACPSNSRNGHQTLSSLLVNTVAKSDNHHRNCPVFLLKCHTQ